MNTHAIVQAVEHWIDTIVIGLNLCPFAGSVRRQQQIHIVVSSASSFQENLQLLADEAAVLQAGDDQRTTLLVLPEGFDEFDDYLDLLATGEALLEDLGYEGVLQLASFHPEYQFADSSAEDVSNWTNRAPFPILHLLQEVSVQQAVEAHPDPEGIPEKNIDTLNALGMAGIRRLQGH